MYSYNRGKGKMSYRTRIYNSFITSHRERQALYNYNKVNLALLTKYYRKTIIDKFLPPDRNIRILDIGCGYGPFIYACIKAGYNNIIGVEGSREQVTFANKLGINGIIQADIMQFLLKNKEQYDVITAIDVIEHFDKNELFDMLDMIYSTLIVGGLFIFQTPNGESPFFGFYRYADFSHETCFNRFSLFQVLKTIGFRDIACYEVAPIIHGFLSGLRWVCWKVIRTIYLFIRIIESSNWKDNPIFSQNIIGKSKK